MTVRAMKVTYIYRLYVTRTITHCDEYRL